MSESSKKTVFDCPVYAQALINPNGPAGACLSFAQAGRISLFVSDYVLQEIRELPSKIRPKFGVTADAVERLIADLAKYATHVHDVPPVYAHPIDPDDSPYVNLALAVDAALIVSRDKHLRELMNPEAPAGIDFMTRYPSIEIRTPDELANELRSQR